MNLIKKWFGIPDIILIAALVILSVIMLSYNPVSSRNSDSSFATVYVNGELYGKYALDTPTSVNIGGTNTLQISDGKVFMSQASCPDQVCVNSPPLKEGSPGFIVCLPNGIVVTVESSDDSDDIDRYDDIA
ncbi:MAG: NusG domain II-containing protein [Lachnospiraceae bacterium]|nr:NusG domain II-containing protein [Lachnospiraceae bacterium]